VTDPQNCFLHILIFQIQFSFFLFIFCNLPLTLNIYVPTGLWLKLSPFTDLNTTYIKPVTYTLEYVDWWSFGTPVDFCNIVSCRCFNNWSFYYAWTLVVVLYSESQEGLSQNSSQDSGVQNITVCSEGFRSSISFTSRKFSTALHRLDLWHVKSSSHNYVTFPEIHLVLINCPICILISQVTWN